MNPAMMDLATIDHRKNACATINCTAINFALMNPETNNLAKMKSATMDRTQWTLKQ